MLSLKLKQEIKKFSLDNINEEICGLIVLLNNIYLFIKCRNISFHKKNESIIHPLDYINATKQGKIVACVHSQPSDSPSLRDGLTAFDFNIYSIVYCIESDKFYVISPELKDYLLKDFKIGVNDCLELWINYYNKELNIKLNNYIRDDNWFINNPTIIYENFEREGFIKINKENMRKHDVILFGKEKNISHIGIYQGNNLLLHHPRDSKSVLEDLNTHYKDKVSLVIRHRDLL